MRVPAVAIGLAIAAVTTWGCGTLDRRPQISSEPPLEAPAAWLDLPDSPFAVSHIGPRAVLVNRTGVDISTVSVGCVAELNGRVGVVGPLWFQKVTHGGRTYDRPLTGVLEDISRLYRAPELFAPSSVRPPRPCPTGSYASITQARSRADFKWSAEGTLWPKGPPHDTRNTWRVSTKTRPTFEYASTSGCFDIYVYAANKTNTEMLWVRLELNRKKLPTERRPLVVNLADRLASGRVQIHMYQTDRHDWLCSDVSYWTSEQPTTWIPRRGILTVWADPQAKDFVEYPVTIRIDDVEFVGPGGATVRPPGRLQIKAVAGGMVGGNSGL